MLRDELATCPRCGRGLDPTGRRLCCGGCEGMLVTEAELRELIAQMESMTLNPAAEHALAFGPPERAEPPIGCPRCAAQMTKHDLYGMLVDRCEAHGVWFDRRELEAALSRVGADATKISLKTKVAMTAVGAAWLAFHIASFLLNTGTHR